MRLSDAQLEALRALRAERGTADLADELSIPAPSLRRILSTGETGRIDVMSLLSDNEEEEPYESDDDEVNELAELWGVKPEDVEALQDALDIDDFEAMTHEELRSYIDDLYERLTDDGWDFDVSDLWDMFYGYAPGAK